MYKLLCRTFINKNKNVLPFTHVYVQRYEIQMKKKIEKSSVSNIKKYWFNKYIDYIKNYDRLLEKNFPRTMHVYRIFSIGTKDFILEVKKYILVMRKQNLYGFDSLTREELQLNYTMRNDLIRIFPVLLISAIPFTSYVIFPLAYYFPRYLLTSHYWTLQQKLDFMLLNHKKRLKHNRPLFRCMQAELPNIENQILRAKWNDIIACLGSGTHPHAEDIITCCELFTGQPYSLDHLRRKHIIELLSIHDIPSWRPFRKHKLIERGMLIKRMDTAIQSEGGTMEMSNEALRWALSFRGLSPANMSTESMRNWLEQWFIVSNIVNEKSISLLLHSPILLAYNHPSNWILVYNRSNNINK
ncbi:LETM1 domain-containing protein 1 [Calliopsis andreniformis]|uniref:LETM1 domain-containing protein 1 n=1 Tax=Calliopsis andreniformis TaxID=337506 RepID=UPI003FCC40E4